MPVTDRQLQESGYPGYAPICKTVVKSTYATYVSDDAGNPVDGYEGTAFAVSPEGHLLTATHVIKGIEDKIEHPDHHLALTRDLSPYRDGGGETIGGIELVEVFDFPIDITVLQMDVDTDEIDSYEYLTLRTGGHVESMGQPTAAFGYPEAINDTRDGWNINQATISGVISSINTFDGFPAYQIDTLFLPGLSGGPLVSLRKGDVIGVVHKREKYGDYDGFGRRQFPAQISEAKVVTSTSISDIGNKLEELEVSYRHEPK